jgi:hypothetical protein
MGFWVTYPWANGWVDIIPVKSQGPDHGRAYETLLAIPNQVSMKC